jgi:hypothetical protein
MGRWRRCGSSRVLGGPDRIQPPPPRNRCDSPVSPRSFDCSGHAHWGIKRLTYLLERYFLQHEAEYGVLYEEVAVEDDKRVDVRITRECNVWWFYLGQSESMLCNERRGTVVAKETTLPGNLISYLVDVHSKMDTGRESNGCAVGWEGSGSRAEGNNLEVSTNAMSNTKPSVRRCS